MDKRKRFIWKGIDARGHLQQGAVFAESQAAARLQLQKQPITLLKLKRDFHLFSGRTTGRDITHFTAELATLIEASIPLGTALAVLKKSTSDQAMGQLIGQLIAQIRNGVSLSDAMRSHPECFDHLFVHLIHASELSGQLDTVLRQVADYRLNALKIRQKVKKALTYPAIVLFVALLVSYAMFVFVLPQFERLFQSTGATLPPFTQHVIHFAHFIKKYTLFMLIAVLVFGIIIRYAIQKYERFAYFLAHWTLRCPLVGCFLKGVIFARVFRTLSMLLKAGIPLLQALRTSTEIVENRVYQKGFLSVIQAIENGESLHDGLLRTELFPEKVLQMTLIGEKSGRLDFMLHKLGAQFEEDINNQLHLFGQLLEPFLMILLCGLVGLLVIAIYLPIFKLGAVI